MEAKRSLTAEEALRLAIAQACLARGWNSKASAKAAEAAIASLKAHGFECIPTGEHKCVISKFTW